MGTAVYGREHVIQIMVQKLRVHMLIACARREIWPICRSAVHGGVHVVQLVAQKLAMRMLMVPPLDDTLRCVSLM